MQWRDLLFLHWRVDPAVIAARLPAGFEVDTFDGSAWVALVPFVMDHVRFFGLPPIPTIHQFCECNVRTYVLRDGVPGVWFHSLDAASRLAVFGGRQFWKLNYVHAEFELNQTGNETDYQLCRADGTHSHVRWRTDREVIPAESGSLPHFLTSRFYLYAGRAGKIERGTIWHEPWTLRRASLESIDDQLIASHGIEVDGDPVVMAADPLDVRGWRNTRVR
jgi:uncharacterized protein YqjF (DUF2071 family)